MKIAEYGGVLSRLLKEARHAFPERSVFARAANDVLAMAGAYQSDGRTFHEEGDLVNALAGFAYGMGWLDAGCSIGLLSCRETTCHPAGTMDEKLPDSQNDRLCEKTLRYRGMFAEALSVIERSPDRDSHLYTGSMRFFAVAQSCYEKGVRYLEERDDAAALACFSYGYAWLDAGVRIGLFRILAKRDLFTV
ncbi:MAG: DUF357 domain-containing protein [Methanomicrobiaceae archaeon]|uniref:DUF357 domain-containing protein n=1 Tax=hydrocarbon metagenome TaxID=938273 RepID=A0A0W8FJ28_9ZZZZ|nr:DUF357 domain-containing protein [Methanomicrobiaceae archaeon]MDD5418383.1 DUF357 domain-containing protein [Methanomicrobiaceae archaeon]